MSQMQLGKATSADIYMFPSVDNGTIHVTKSHAILADELTNIPEKSEPPMSTLTREELDAKLELLETRMDNRVTRIEGKIDTLLVKIDERENAADSRIARIEDDLKGISSETRNFKYWLIGLVIPTAVGSVIAIAAFNGTILSNMLASFESGKNTTAAQLEVKRQVEETSTLLKQMQERANAPAKR